MWDLVTIFKILNCFVKCLILYFNLMEIEIPIGQPFKVMFMQYLFFYE